MADALLKKTLFLLFFVSAFLLIISLPAKKVKYFKEKTFKDAETVI